MPLEKTIDETQVRGLTYTMSFDAREARREEE